MNANEIKAYSNGKKNGVKVFVAGSYEALSKKAASIVAGAISNKPEFVLGLATGTSPLGLYSELATLNAEGRVDFAGVTTYNLDEYYPIDPANDQSYRHFMNKNLFNNVNVDMDKTHVLFGQAPDWKAECAQYDAEIEALGGIDLQVLGIGNNAHIGFNEPADSFTDGSFKVKLTDSTIEANKIYFDENPMPHYALTMGVNQIMSAKKIVLIATGPKKAEAIRNMIKGEVTPQVPASILQNHDDVEIFLDEAAASLL